MTTQLCVIDPAEAMVDELWKKIDGGEKRIRLDTLKSMILDRLIELRTNDTMQLPAALQEIYDCVCNSGNSQVATLKLDVVIARIEQDM